MPAVAEKLTQARLKEVLAYDKKSGIFTWRKHRYPQRNGFTAGKQNPQHGYIVIGIDAWPHLAHRLAWLYVKGIWPAYQIDHIDGNRTNNSFNNLRDLSHTGNMQNLKQPKRNNSTGFLGVVKHGNKFRSRICVNRKIHDLGLFSTAKKAHNAYIRAKRNLHVGCTL